MDFNISDAKNLSFKKNDVKISDKNKGVHKGEEDKVFEFGGKQANEDDCFVFKKPTPNQPGDKYIVPMPYPNQPEGGYKIPKPTPNEPDAILIVPKPTPNQPGDKDIVPMPYPNQPEGGIVKPKPFPNDPDSKSGAYIKTLPWNPEDDNGSRYKLC